MADREEGAEEGMQNTRTAICFDIADDNVFTQWWQVGKVNGLATSAEIAKFLLQSYEKYRTGPEKKNQCVDCQSALVLVCPTCQLPSSSTTEPSAIPSVTSPALKESSVTPAVHQAPAGYSVSHSVSLPDCEDVDMKPDMHALPQTVWHADTMLYNKRMAVSESSQGGQQGQVQQKMHVEARKLPLSTGPVPLNSKHDYSAADNIASTMIGGINGTVAGSTASTVTGGIVGTVASSASGNVAGCIVGTVAGSTGGTVTDGIVGTLADSINGIMSDGIVGTLAGSTNGTITGGIVGTVAGSTNGTTSATSSWTGGAEIICKFEADFTDGSCSVPNPADRLGSVRCATSEVSVVLEDIMKNPKLSLYHVAPKETRSNTKMSGLTDMKRPRKKRKDAGVKRGTYSKRTSEKTHPVNNVKLEETDSELVSVKVPDEHGDKPQIQNGASHSYVSYNKFSREKGVMMDLSIASCQDKKHRERQGQNYTEQILNTDPASLQEKCEQSQPPKSFSKRNKAQIEKMAVCETCGKELRNKNALYAHMQYHKEKKHTCNECGEAFFKRWQLQVHSYKHTGERPFPCHLCDATFTRKSCLKQHVINIHQNSKPFVCDKCGKSFNQMSSLQIHLRRHTGEKPYACRYCHLRFVDGPSLQSHTRTHTGSKPHVCTECGVRFSSSSNLRMHMRVHTGERPFVCSECGHGCSTSSYLRKHMWKHTGQKPKPAACNICGNVLSSAGKLARHMKNIHGWHKPAKREVLPAQLTPVISGAGDSLERVEKELCS